MPRHPRKSQYKEIKKQVIFLLRSPKSKEFYVGHCQPNSLMPVFRQHWSGDRNYTDKCFLELKKEGLHPCLTVLEEVYLTDVEAYKHEIAWTKILVDAGYKNLNTGNIECYMEDMFGETLSAYEQNKDSDIDEICDCKSCLVSIYGHKTCPLCTCDVPEKVERPKGKDPKGTQLHIRMSEDELRVIEKNARICDKTVSAYVRQVATEMCVLPLDYECITAHTHEITTYKNAIDLLVFTIVKTGNYVPVDLEYILEKTDQLLKSEKNFLEQYGEFYDRNRKLIRKCVSRTVKDIANGTVR